MTQINNGKKRPRINNKEEAIAPEILKEEEIVEEEVIEEVEVADVVCEEAPIEEIGVVEEISAEEPEVEELEEVVEETVEETEEVPLEMSEEEMQIALDEEGSLDGTAEEVEELANEEIVEEAPACQPTEEVVVEEIPVEEIVEEEVAPVVEETAIVEVVSEEPAPAIEEVVAEETPVEEPAPVAEEIPVEETVAEEVAPVEEPAAEVAEEATAEDDEEDAEEEKVEEAPKKDEFKLTAPANLEEILANICTKRARKLIYRPADVIFSHTTTVLGTDKANEEKIKIKSILDAEIKQGVKLGYLDKFDGLKMSELKEEYENDIVYEYADQEFKRTGILLDGDKVKVYVYDWDMKACHHVGYIDEESANLVRPFIEDKEKYSFDINGIIVGGKYKKVIKDEKSGKITVEKGNDGNLGLEIDINIINRKD